MTEHEYRDCDSVFELWTVYSNPRDCPGKVVVRRWSMPVSDPGYPLKMRPDAERWAVKDTLDDARLTIPPGLVRLPRQPEDDSCIVENWL